MAEINLGRVKADAKDAKVLTLEEYIAIPMIERLSGDLYYIRDEFGRVYYKNVRIWQPPLSSNYVTAAESDFDSSVQETFTYIGSDSYIFIPSNIFSGYIMDGTVKFENNENVKGVACDTNRGTLAHLFSWAMDHGSLEVTGLQTINVRDMSHMFNFTESLRGMLDCSTFNTKNVLYMDKMFYECGADDINVSSFDTSKVTTMGEMFVAISCKELDLSSFNMSSVVNTDNMFYQCNSTERVYCRTEADAIKMRNSTNCPPQIEFIVL